MTMIVQLLLSHSFYRAFSYYALHLISQHGEWFEELAWLNSRLRLKIEEDSDEQIWKFDLGKIMFLNPKPIILKSKRNSMNCRGQIGGL